MKIIIRATDEDTMYDGYRNSLEIEIQDSGNKRLLRFYDGEPEDNNLNRNFNDVYSISGLMKQAYDAGMRGENFEIVEEPIER